MDETAEAEEPGNSVEPKQDVDEGVGEEEDAYLWYKCLEVWWKMEDILPSSSFGPFVKKHSSFSKDPEHRIVGGFLFTRDMRYSYFNQKFEEVLTDRFT